MCERPLGNRAAFGFAVYDFNPVVLAMNGWHGNVLHVDLSSQTAQIESPRPEIYHRFIGGRGLAGHYLSAHATCAWNDPHMPILLCVGPLTGSSSPTPGMLTIMSRSPLTGAIGDVTAGGSLGAAIKRSGLDGIVITGHARRLTGLEINNGRVTFSDAENLAGKATGDVFSTLKTKAAAAIGPAAERGVRFSCIVIDGYGPAGRDGLGLCFAAKNLKYITAAGDRSTKVADSAALEEAREDIRRLCAASSFLCGELGIGSYGTGALYDLVSSRRMMPTGNFTKTFFPSARDMNAHAYARRYAPIQNGCEGCHIRCLRTAADGRQIPAYEAMSHFSALLENSEIDTVIAAHHLCCEQGMDPISAAATLGAYAEIEKLTLEPHQILSLLETMGCNFAPGNDLGAGAAAYAAARGAPSAAMTVKGQELSAYDPRGAYGMALACAVSTRGGSHLSAFPISHEILRKPVATDRFTFSGKARIIKLAEDAHAALDSLNACPFITLAASLEEYARLYTAVTGVDTSGHDLQQIGERIYYRERMINAQNGFSRTDDDLPSRFFEQPGSSGNGIQIAPLDKNAFKDARERYYRIRGLNSEGRPAPEKAAELELL